MSVIVNGGGGRTIDAVPTPNSNNPVASGGVYNAIASLPQPMVFKGTVGTGGTITTLPSASSSNEGFTYKVITDGTYASQTAKVGDMFVSNGTEWVLIPSGDEENDTWRNIKVNNSEILGNGISTGALNLKNGTNVSISADGGDVSISATDTTYESKSAVSGGTDVSLVTTGEKYAWNNKVNPSSLSDYLLLIGGTMSGSLYMGNSGAILPENASSSAVGYLTQPFLSSAANHVYATEDISIKATATTPVAFSIDSTGSLSGSAVDTAPTEDSNHIVTSGGVYQALTDGSVTKIGTATVGSSTQPIYLNGGVPTAITGALVTGVKGDAEATYRTGTVNLTKANVGLGSVVNTGDSDTPVSGGTTKFTTGGAFTELAKKVDTTRKVNGHALSADVTVTASDVGAIPTTQKGANNGVAELDSNGKVPSSQLPSYVDDVLEYPSQSAFPSTGETGKIYVATDTNKTYRWSGTDYVEISPSLALGETSSTAYRGDRGKTAYDHASETKAGQTASGLYKVASTAQGHISSLTAVQKSDITGLGIPAQDTTYSAATQSANGLMSSTDKTKLDGIATGAEVNQNAFSNVKVGSSTVAADSKTDTLELVAGSNVTLTPDTTNDKVTIAATDTTYSNATTSAAGLMSSTDKTKLNGIATGAEVNQNAFANVKVGSTTVAADAKQDILELVAGSNVTLTPDATNDKVTIAATDTTYESKSAASGGTAVSLVTTGEKYTWGQKQSALSTMSSSELTTGTATTARSVRADYLKSGVNSLIDTKINGLDGGTIGTPSASKTLTALSETNGNISATFGNIAIAESQVTNLTTDLAAKLPLSGGIMTGDIVLGLNGEGDSVGIFPAANSTDSYIGGSGNRFRDGFFSNLDLDGDLSVDGNISSGGVFIGDLLGDVTGTASSADKIGTNTVGSSTQPVYINGGVPTAAGYLMTQTSTTVASSGWTAESYTSPSGTVYGYKKEVSITGMTASSYIDGDISSGTYTGAYAFESDSGKAIIRTATQPSASLTFRIYYQI